MHGRCGLIALALALVPQAGWAAPPTPNAQPTGLPTAASTPGLARWEYRVVTYDRVAMFSDSEQELRLLGLMGWELVDTTYDPNARTIVCFLKRPLR